MKSLYFKLPVRFNFFGGVKPFDSQCFDTMLAEFREKAYASLTENRDFPRASCLIDGRASCLVDDGIDAIRTLLSNLWKNPEKLNKLKWPEISAYMWVDENHTAYSVKIMYRHDLMLPPCCETAESSNFKEANKAETDEVIQKYGFTEIPAKQYRVRFDKYEAVLTEQQLSELRAEHQQWYFNVVEEVK